MANKLSSQKLKQAMALVFLGFNRQQIEKLLSIKSETLKTKLCENLLKEVHEGEVLDHKEHILNEEKWRFWANKLGKQYGLKEAVLYLPLNIEELPHTPVSEAELFDLLKKQPREPVKVTVKILRQILGRGVQVEGLHFVTQGDGKKPVRISTSRFS